MAKQLVGKYWHDFECPKSLSNIALCTNQRGCEPQKVVERVICRNEDFQWDNRVRNSPGGQVSGSVLLCLDCMKERKTSCFQRDNSTRSGYRTICERCMKKEDKNREARELLKQAKKEGFVMPEDGVDIVSLKLINQLPASRAKYYPNAQVIVNNGKLCSRCDKVKFVHAFYPAKGKKSGLDSQCKSCRKFTQESLRASDSQASVQEPESSD